MATNLCSSWGGGINYLLDNNNYNNIKCNYKDKFSKGLNFFVVFIFTTNVLCKNKIFVII